MQSVVDMLRWDNSMPAKNDLPVENSDEDFGIKEMANLIGRPLVKGRLKYNRTAQQGKRVPIPLQKKEHLVRIRGEDSTYVYESGASRTLNCYMCRRHKQKPQNTNCWICKECGMPLCKPGLGHDQTCLEEYLHSQNEYLGCGFIPRASNNSKMPDDLKLFVPTSTPAKSNRGKKVAGKKRAAVVTTPSPPPKRVTRSQANK